MKVFELMLLLRPSRRFFRNFPDYIANHNPAFDDSLFLRLLNYFIIFAFMFLGFIYLGVRRHYFEFSRSTNSLFIRIGCLIFITFIFWIAHYLNFPALIEPLEVEFIILLSAGSLLILSLYIFGRYSEDGYSLKDSSRFIRCSKCKRAIPKVSLSCSYCGKNQEK